MDEIYENRTYFSQRNITLLHIINGIKQTIWRLFNLSHCKSSHFLEHSSKFTTLTNKYIRYLNSVIVFIVGICFVLISSLLINSLQAVFTSHSDIFQLNPMFSELLRNLFIATLNVKNIHLDISRNSHNNHKGNTNCAWKLPLICFNMIFI